MIYGGIAGDILGEGEVTNGKLPSPTKKGAKKGANLSITDDSVHTLAVARALNESTTVTEDGIRTTDLKKLKELTAYYLYWYTRNHPNLGYGDLISTWANQMKEKKAMEKAMAGENRSYGNGAAMRIAPVAWAARNLDELKEMVHAVTFPTHNNPAAFLMAEATAVTIFMFRKGYTKEIIREYIGKHYYKEFTDSNFTIDNIKEKKWPTAFSGRTYCRAWDKDKGFQDMPVDETAPIAILAALESNTYSEAVEKATSCSTDKDTVGCIVGAIKEAEIGVDEKTKADVRQYVDARDTQFGTDLEAFEKKFRDTEWEERIKAKNEGRFLPPDDLNPSIAEQGKWVLESWDEIMRCREKRGVGDGPCTVVCKGMAGFEKPDVTFKIVPVMDEDGKTRVGWFCYSTDTRGRYNFFRFDEELDGRVGYQKVNQAEWEKAENPFDAYYDKNTIQRKALIDMFWGGSFDAMQVFRRKGSLFPSRIARKEGAPWDQGVIRHTDHYTPEGKLDYKTMSVLYPDGGVAIEAVLTRDGKKVDYFCHRHLSGTDPSKRSTERLKVHDSKYYLLKDVRETLYSFTKGNMEGKYTVVSDKVVSDTTKVALPPTGGVKKGVKKVAVNPTGGAKKDVTKVAVNPTGGAKKDVTKVAVNLKAVTTGGGTANTKVAVNLKAVTTGGGTANTKVAVNNQKVAPVKQPAVEFPLQELYYTQQPAQQYTPYQQGQAYQQYPFWNLYQQQPAQQYTPYQQGQAYQQYPSWNLYQQQPAQQYTPYQQGQAYRQYPFWNLYQQQPAQQYTPYQQSQAYRQYPYQYQQPQVMRYYTSYGYGAMTYRRKL